MNLVERLKNIWALGEAVQKEEDTFYDHEEKMQEIRITPPPKKDIFIPRITRDPIKSITEENNDN